MITATRSYLNHSRIPTCRKSESFRIYDMSVFMMLSRLSNKNDYDNITIKFLSHLIQFTIKVDTNVSSIKLGNKKFSKKIIFYKKFYTKKQEMIHIEVITYRGIISLNKKLKSNPSYTCQKLKRKLVLASSTRTISRYVNSFG